MELSSPGDEYQNKSLEFGFSDETTSASSIEKGKNDNISEHFYNINRFICQKERIWFQNFKEELIITVLDQNQNKSMELESPNKTTNEFSNDNGKPKIIILFWNLVRKKIVFRGGTIKCW